MKKKYKLIKADKLLIKLIKYLSKGQKKQKGVKIIMATETPKIMSVTVKFDGKEVEQFFVSKEDYESLLTKISELNSTIANQYAQTEEFKTKFEADKKELEGELKSTASKLESTNEELKTEIRKAQEFKGKFESVSQDLLNTKDNLDKKEKELTLTKKNALDKLNSLNAELENKKSEITSLNDNIQAKESEISSKNSEISSLKSSISNLEDDISKLNEEYCSSLYEDFLALPEEFKNNIASCVKNGANLLMFMGSETKLDALYKGIKTRLNNSKGELTDDLKKLIGFFDKIIEKQMEIDENIKRLDADSKEYYPVNGGTGKLNKTLLVGYKYGGKTQVNLVLCD
ncbi:coiled-coil domain-containing protein [Campylobacter devanensis]|uniref:coiled-coil domain-containing protein n=1 Tax=Campylobacter devanensis TaxID=3161138 RepID=UPI000A354697|nr:hypothetical protein [Campylobacter sp. P090]